MITTTTDKDSSTREACHSAHEAMKGAAVEITAAQARRDQIAAALTTASQQLAQLDRDADAVTGANVGLSEAQRSLQEIAGKRPQCRDYVDSMFTLLESADRVLVAKRLEGLEAEHAFAAAQSHHLVGHRRRQLRQFIQAHGAALFSVIRLFQFGNAANGVASISYADSSKFVFAALAHAVSQAGSETSAIVKPLPVSDIDGVPLAEVSLRALDNDRDAARRIDPSFAELGKFADKAHVARELLRREQERGAEAQAADAARYQAKRSAA